MNLYRQNILDHYHHPRNAGELKDVDCKISLDNPLCGDLIAVTVKLSGDQIKAIKYQAIGCAVSIAAMSMLSEKAKDQSVAEVQSWGEKEILEMLGIEVSATRLKCAMLGLRTLQKCLNK
ncbi:MAG TPA: Fe-S cluster protein [Candidatus Jacksonbacteria bacterium]|nr:MAG: hypothetical protein UW45_C0029G0004 [Parcubacteria group bacterium GW2011_GWC2_44_22]HBH45984.1 Fe-S cluster protein [Candidatus Jacksonbacteria bacterium]HCC49755.1 Fe-S cluster protein [Candidatus Jacksonbacteria bacterium]HCE49222.1 Fe-S cluster protein [Candidatus Jacksonbacteria bacterium]HCR15568.1 Fe-S cluster protein [Candidatus Jacksonbacteria bacterium]